MKAIVNELYRLPLSNELLNHIMEEIGFGDDEKLIANSLRSKNA